MLDATKIQLLGNGSTILGIVILIFAVIGFLNIAIATLLWFEKILKILDDNGIESMFALFVVIVISIMGLIAFIVATVRLI
jgi:hypothetical protein